MICVLKVLASVCIPPIQDYELTLYAHILSQIIVSINSLWPHFTGCTKFFISWQFAGWQEGERRKKMQTQNRVGIGTWQSVRAIYHPVKLHWLLQQNHLQCKKIPTPTLKMAECWREEGRQIKHVCHFTAISPAWPHSVNESDCSYQNINSWRFVL